MAVIRSGTYIAPANAKQASSFQCGVPGLNGGAAGTVGVRCHGEARMCPTKAAQWVTVTGTFTARASTTTVALHSEGAWAANFRNVQVYATSTSCRSSEAAGQQAAYQCRCDVGLYQHYAKGFANSGWELRYGVGSHVLPAYARNAVSSLIIKGRGCVLKAFTTASFAGKTGMFYAETRSVFTTQTNGGGNGNVGQVEEDTRARPSRISLRVDFRSAPRTVM